jgi:hypothetical protein
MIGDRYQPEAVIPLKNGRVPVEMGQQAPPVVNVEIVNVTGKTPARIEADARMNKKVIVNSIVEDLDSAGPVYKKIQQTVRRQS